MSGRYPVLRGLDPHHQRLGYLGALALVAERGIDSPESVLSRLYGLLFEKIYPEDSRYELLLSRIPESVRNDLIADRKKTKDYDDFTNILSDNPEKTGWFFISELWLYDKAMYSSIGMQWPKYLNKTVQFGKWSRLLLPTYELSEAGSLLQYLLLEVRNDAGVEYFNPLQTNMRPAIWLLYTRIVLQSEVFFPYLLEIFLERLNKDLPLDSSGESGLLKLAVDRFIEKSGPEKDPDEIYEFLEIFKFRDSIAGNASTEKNYLRPRMELLVDLGLLSPKSEQTASRTDFRWRANEKTGIAAKEWYEITENYQKLDDYLEKKFFGSMAKIAGCEMRISTETDEQLLFFTQAFEKVGREFGFTPGRTLAILACLMAWENGILMEIDTIFKTVENIRSHPISRYYHFSGGSTFDREFLVRIDPQAIVELMK